jgi:serine/threonine protein kinase/TolB-like protein/Tfp pilus assembly protein PilF
MTPDRWQQVQSLFLASLKVFPDERAAFLSQACSGDVVLLQEVESLLAMHASSDHVLDSGIGIVAARLLDEDEAAPLAGQILGSYRVIREIGRGGMGEVYLAHDTRLDRPVAIKLLPAAFHDDPERLRRFQQEARAASLLNHPNIVTIYEVAESEHLPFIVSEFVEGKTLRVLIQDGSLKLGDALDVIIQTAGALGAAHAAGIVHRDIKPENIMVRDDGYVKVLDFGLAKLTERGHIDAPALEGAGIVSEPSTMSGIIVGTVKYMSPEQARGERVDHRSDIFSLGVVLYETIAGRTPFAGKSSSDELASILRDDAPPLTRFVVDVPEQLADIVGKALQKEAGDRYQTVTELQRDLRNLRQDLDLAKRVSLGTFQTGPQDSAGNRRNETTVGDRPGGSTSAQTPAADAGSSESLRFQYLVNRIRRRKQLILTAAIFLMIFAGVLYYFMLPNGFDSLAVLPFDYVSAEGNSAAGADQDYIADGLVESIIQTLSQVPKLTVIAHSSVLRYKGERTDPREAGRLLNVQTILTGRITQHGDKLVVSAEMVDARNDRRLWGERYEVTVADLQVTQRRIVRGVSERLRVGLTGEDQHRMSRGDTVSSEAYQLYLKGRYLWNQRNEDSIRRAIEYYREALARDENYALAYAGLAEAYVLLADYNGIAPGEVNSMARDAAAKALSIDEDLAEAHTSLAAVFVNQWNWSSAIAEFRRAVDLNPNYATAHQWYGLCLAQLGRFDEALLEVERAKDLDPVSISINSAVGTVLYYSAKYEQAIGQFEKTIELTGGSPGVRIHLGRAYEQAGRQAEAVRKFEEAHAVANGIDNQADLACACAMAGDRASALRYLQEIRTAPPSAFKKSYAIAKIFAALEDKDQAFASLNESFEKHEVDLDWVAVDPQLQTLRKDPRLEDLLRRMGLLTRGEVHATS